MENVAVFCGSSPGARPAYAAAARSLGTEIARRGLGLVYGGGHVGLMGVVADAALAGGARVVGVIPRSLSDRELAHGGLSELHVVGGMHERKALMADLAGAFVALPGGFGTLDELCEVLTWSQLGFHAKPIGILDVADYFAPLRALVDRAVEEGFVRAEHRALIVHGDDAGRLLDRLAVARPAPITPKWRDR